MLDLIVTKYLKNINLCILLFCLVHFTQNYAITTGIISAVYNLAIAETTLLITQEFKSPFAVDLTFFEEARWQRKRYGQKNGDRAQAIGEMLSFLYITEPFNNLSWYIRADFAFARVSEKDDRKSIARVQTDDFLITGGYSWSWHPKIRCTFSGLFGIPTHKDTSLNLIEFGTGHLGLGVQFDSAINYSSKNKNSLRLAARLIGTIPRNNVFKACNFNYNLGEIIDFFISHHAPFGNHCFEIGYNPIFVAGSGLSPHCPAIESELNLVRNSYFIAYEYSFEIKKKINNAIEAGLSFASDILPKKTGQKLIVLGWFTWDVSF